MSEHERKIDGAVAFLRENWRDDGAEGESVHLLCDEIASLRTALAAAESQRDAAVAVLREVQWNATRAGVAACPSCGNFHPNIHASNDVDHAPDCSLAAAIAAGKVKP